MRSSGWLYRTGAVRHFRAIFRSGQPLRLRDGLPRRIGQNGLDTNNGAFSILIDTLPARVLLSASQTVRPDEPNVSSRNLILVACSQGIGAPL